ncbi:na[+]/H[+] hydrogen exchanger 2 isoform X24 [Musca autumnalis]|uniref:na[+]/H[+] hydrogen exchanger 2 isoform X24 n=1 Tax=Musca autumnalis TaxID=221902 RepID=UPI003CF9E0A6
MFQDLFLRNSNEIFFRGPENGDDNANKQQQRAKDFVKSSPLPPSLQNQKQKSPKFTNTTTTSENMAVSKKIMESKMEQHKKAPLSLDKKKTSSLEQELNLARRACWCSSVSAGNGGGDDDEGDGLLDRKSINECCEKCFKSNDDNVNDDNDNDDIGQTTNLEKTTTVLNGAKIIFSKNINNTTTKTTNDNTMNSNKLAENSFSVKKPHEVAAATDGSDVIPTTTTTTNNLIKRKLNSKSQEHNKEEHDNDVDDDVNEDIVNKNSKLAASSSSTSSTSASASSLSKFKASIKALLLALWLGFVNFCERNTIKRNDPRFEIYRQKPETQMQQSTTTASSSANDPKADKRKPFQFKLLTSKKVIFLLLVCFFFSCIQRIDARPNTAAGGSGADGNAVTGQAVGVGAESVYTVTPGKVNSLPASNTALPPESVNSNAIKQPKSTDGGGSEAPQSAGTTGNDIKLNTDSSSGRPAVAVPHSDDDDNDHGDDDGGHSGGHERYPLAQVEFDRVKTPFIIGVWILSASIAKIGFHMTPKLHLIFPESCLLIVVGVVIGVVLFFCTDVAVSPLTPNTFFFYMLPPIILDAGYFMPNRLFFDNLGTILLMAVVGTIFNIATIGGSLWACGLTGIFGGPEDTPRFLDIFIFASLISAVDPVAVLAVFEEIHVNEILYIVVFGESLLNDAVTVVMYHMMEVYNHIGISEIIAQDVVNGVGSFFVVAVGGTVIGIIWGFLTGLVTRFTDHVRVIEPIFIFVMAYLAYLNAEIFHMSGILAITFCGITMKNYVESNISQKSHTTVKYALKMLSSSSETIIFMFLGVATVNNSHVWNTWFVILTIVFCSVFRVIGVIILSAMANRFRLHKLSRVDQFVMSYGGLRGAVAFALVLLIDETIVPQKNMFVTTTIAVIYFTVFVQGITIKPLVKILNVKRANKRKPTMNERIHERFMDHLMAGIEDIVGKTGNYNVRDKFKRFDNRFIRPLLLRDLKGAEPKIIETYSKLTMRDAIEVMRRNPSTIGQITGTESMSALFRNYTNNCIGGRWAPPTIYTTCPSLTNLDNTCSRNLDMHELDYNPSKKDLTDAKIHHLLAEELKPYRRHRRLSYSRHAVDDRDLSTQVNYKMQMNFRRMFNDRKHHKRSKRGANKDGVKQNHVSFHDFQQNGTTKQFSHEENPNNKLTEVTVVGENDDWEDGLTFTAKSSLAEHAIPEEDRNLSRDSDGERRVATPTATESQLPWKRQGDEVSDAVQQNEFPAWASNKEYLAYNSPSATFLGLFRRESSGSRGGVGGSIITVDGTDGGSSARGSDPALAAALSQMVVPSSTIPYNPRLDKRSQSISSGSGSAGIGDSGHSGPFPVTASHRRNVRRGSMLELTGDTIPEESYHHGYSKSLCEPAGEEWEAMLAEAERADHASTNSEKLLRSGREPLLPRLTPRAQIRRGLGVPTSGGPGVGSASSSALSSGGNKRSHVTTALLSTSTSDYDDDNDEDFDLYDDENIVVTTISNDPMAHRRDQRGGGGATGSGSDGEASSATTSTTTIRLTRNNDESII